MWSPLYILWGTTVQWCILQCFAYCDWTLNLAWILCTQWQNCFVFFSTGRSPQNIENANASRRLNQNDWENYTRTSPAAFIVYLAPGLDVFDEVNYSVWVAIFIVVPEKETFHELNYFETAKVIFYLLF